ncbi:uncharacterized protein LOC103389356 isoform X2 [Cynoglossus semilaevis]|uniref:uncharacterized protein LOC103389356 isoform X2 n=1 Tax=Cynoglossus semilaevis TaxID=244447 RepID=UPI000D62B789|nr:uncharacterized protein LOC103389356 isoform X2 [Cynoglossus semilaevis]
MLITKLYRRPSGTCSLCHVTQIQANKKPRATSKMASPPLSSSGDRCWTEEKERALIAFFSKHSCLWNHKSDGYKNRHLRWETLEHLKNLLSTHPPPVPVTVEDIKNKFKNLRTTFQRQYKMGCSEQDDEGGGADDIDDQALSLQPLTLPQEEEEEVVCSQSDQPASVILASILPIPALSFSSSSSHMVSSKMLVKCFWTEERERALISFYSDHDCLWNKNSEHHKNRPVRLRLLESLSVQLSNKSVTFTVDDIKSKFKNLRTVFYRENKAVTASRASGKPYVSKWKHYQQLLFLYDSCDEEDPTNSTFTTIMDNSQMLSPEDEEESLEEEHQTPFSVLDNFSCRTKQTQNTSAAVTPAATSISQSEARSRSNIRYQVPLPTSTDSISRGGPTAAPTLPSSSSASLQETNLCVKPSTVKVIPSARVETDGRLSAESVCNWSEVKVQQLISFYSEHSCLWNHRSESYRNRLLKQSLLETLSSLLSENEPVPFTVHDIKAKFRSLRTVFQREHKAVSSNKTCGSEDFYLPKWKYFSELMFLCDSCDEDDECSEVDNFNTCQETSSLRLAGQAQLSSSSSSSSSSLTYHTNIQAPPSPTPPDSEHSTRSPSPSSCCHADSKASSRKRPRSQQRALPSSSTTFNSSQVLDLMLYQSQTVSPHVGFLKYVEECLNEMPTDKVKKLKKKIIETIHSVSEEL